METPPPLPGARSAPATISPLAEHQRHEFIDVVRGFAIFGIFLVNIIGFKSPFAATASMGERWHPGAANEWTLVAIEVFAASKFVTMFALIFGIGIALQYKRSVEVGRPFRGFFLRRMIVLLGLGIVHGIFLWAGDILAIYALCGIFALIFVRSRPGVLVAWAIAFFALSLLAVAVIMHAFLVFPDETDWWRGIAEWWTTAYSEGSLSDILLARLAEWGLMWASALTYFVFFVFALILLGMLIGRTGFLEKMHQWRPRLAICAAIGLPAGIALNGVWVLEAIGFPMNFGFYITAYVASFPGSVWLSLSYIVCIYFLVTSGRLRWLVTRMAAVGRLALTNYLMQSIVANAIFMSWGLGLYGDVEAHTGVLIVFAVFICQLIGSSLWLRFFRIGPFEWLWRAIAYGTPPPFRRK